MNVRTFKTTVTIAITQECLDRVGARYTDVENINGMISATLSHIHDESGESLPYLGHGADFDVAECAGGAPKGVESIHVSVEELK